MLTQLVTLIAAALVLFAPTARADDATAMAEASNMQIIGRSDLNGAARVSIPDQHALQRRPHRPM